MTMTLHEAVGVLKERSAWIKLHFEESTHAEAIDTVVAEVEKHLITNEDVETWNAAIDAAAENAEAYRGLVDKQSILKLKK